MESPIRKAIILGLLLASAGITTAQNIVPKITDRNKLGDHPFESVGFLDIEVDDSYFRGSAAVVRTEQLLYTCGHNVLDESGFPSAIMAFSRAWSSRRSPPLSGLVPLRGSLVRANYSEAVTNDGPDSARAFGEDFAVAFAGANDSLGPPLKAQANGSQFITGQNEKMIIGYPARLDFNGRKGFHFQHTTGPFNRPFENVFSQFYEMGQISTGSGNSGEPVVARVDNEWQVVGTLVAGSGRRSNATAGIFSVDSEAEGLADDAQLLTNNFTSPVDLPTEVSQTFSAVTPRLIRDGRKRFVRRVIRVRDAPNYVTGVSLTLRVIGQDLSSMEIFLRSPAGRTFTIDPSSHLTANGVELVAADITGPFYGSRANGRWKVFLRNRSGSAPAELTVADLEVTSR